MKNTLMIVDDQQQNLQLVASIFQDIYNLIIATDGKKALEILKSKKPDLILLDIMMPDLDGYEVCKVIKGNPETNQIPVIFLTAKKDEDSISRGFECGAVDYVTKPFNSREVIARVKTHIALKVHSDTKDKTFSIIAHDLKNILGGIIGVGSLLQGDLGKYSESDFKRMGSIVHASANAAHLALENLVVWSKTQLGLLMPQKTLVEINQVVRSIIEQIRLLAENKNISLDIIEEESYRIKVDVTMIEIVIRNILTNAIKYSHNYGSVKIFFENTDENLTIMITDDGVGISEEDIKVLFDKHASISKPGTKNEKGTGLGLQLCMNLVNMNGGEITVHSQLGVGSTFIVSLPKE